MMSSSSTTTTNDTTTNNNNNSKTSDNSVWSLSVKAIGSALKHCQTHSHDEDDDDDNVEPQQQQRQQEQQHFVEAEKNFTVTVSPEDGVTSLYDQIEGVTGLKSHQQRLIYRGRLIQQYQQQDSHKRKEAADCSSGGGDDEPKIKDITGLADGHTIHLVKREGNASGFASGSAEPTEGAENGNNNNNGAERTTTSNESNNSSSLLAALIGLGGMEDGSSTSAPTTGRRLRGSRLGRSRRPPYRLTAEDWQRPDPGSLETVRQGLMTIHTMLPHASIATDTTSSTSEQEQQSLLPSPLDANRTWYKGQWIDVRDTVNCWLEATIVDMVRPDEILPPCQSPSNTEQQQQRPPRSVLEPATDPAVFSGDLEGRRRLLLEPCDDGDDDDEGGDLAGFRRRATNEGVKLLLIHYNGWPHRWDEWIRSDSERIRPFRTRTRHPSMSSYSSPSVQTVYNESPATYIRAEDNVAERSAALPELHRAMTAVNQLLAQVAEEETANIRSLEQQEDLPWAVRTDVQEEEEDGLDELPPLTEEAVTPPATTNVNETASEQHEADNTQQGTSSNSRVRRRQLELLAPLLDRLGRTLIDAAPHVASLAAQPSEDAAADESISTNEAVVASEQPTDENPSTLGGLLSLLSRDRRRNASSSNNNNNASSNVGDGDTVTTASHQAWPVDPDYVDFATGVVNTTRGEVRSGPRSRSSNDDVAGLLGAYLAAASLGLNPSGGDSDSNNDDSAGNVLGLGRLLRDRNGGGGGGGGNGPGIDIHIHAVVTAPGMAPTTIGGGGGGFTGGGGGGFGLATMPGATIAGNNITAARASLSSPARERRGSGSSLLRMRHPPIIQQEEEEDLGLFDELYSENPAPVDPNGSPQPGGGSDENGHTTSRNTDGDFLTRLAHARPSHTLGSGNSHSRHDPFAAASPSRISRASLSRNSSGESSRRSSTHAPSPRRSSLMGRLFRRSRRSSG